MLIASFQKYFLIDAARIFGELQTAQTLQTNFLSLYKGASEESLNSVAPYLFFYQPNSDFASWLLENSWGNSWGIFVETKITIEELKNHFYKFLVIKLNEGGEMYFRFYDPRVIKVFLPTYDKNKIVEFFGPIESFICEGETKNEAIRFWHQNGELKQEILSVEKVFGATTATQEQE